MKRDLAFSVVASLLAGLMLTGCQTKMVRRANQMIAAGEYEKAEKYLASELRDRPTDEEGFMLLGRLQLMVGNPTEANRSFDRAVRLGADATREIPVAFFEVAKKIYEDFPRGPENDQRIGACLRGAVGRAPEMREEVIDWAVRRAVRSFESRDGRNPKTLLVTAVQLSPDAAASVIGPIEREARARLDREDFTGAAGLADLLILLEAGARQRAAEILRDVALAEESAGRFADALISIQKAVRIHPPMGGELEVVLLRSKLERQADAGAARPADGTAPAANAGVARVSVEETVRRMTRVSAALSSYRADYDRFPIASNMRDLERQLRDYVKGEFPLTDEWGTELRYVTNDSAISYRLVSGGSDGVIDTQSLNIGGLRSRAITSSATADLIIENAVLVQAPQESPAVPAGGQAPAP